MVSVLVGLMNGAGIKLKSVYIFVLLGFVPFFVYSHDTVDTVMQKNIILNRLEKDRNQLSECYTLFDLSPETCLPENQEASSSQTKLNLPLAAEIVCKESPYHKYHGQTTEITLSWNQAQVRFLKMDENNPQQGKVMEAIFIEKSDDENSLKPYLIQLEPSDASEFKVNCIKLAGKDYNGLSLEIVTNHFPESAPPSHGPFSVSIHCKSFRKKPFKCFAGRAEPIGMHRRNPDDLGSDIGLIRSLMKNVEVDEMFAIPDDPSKPTFVISKKNNDVEILPIQYSTSPDWSSKDDKSVQTEVAREALEALSGASGVVQPISHDVKGSEKD